MLTGDHDMNKFLNIFLSATFLMASTAATAYTIPPSSEKMYPQCVKAINDMYTGGNARSPIRNQTKAQAYCICLWNETPEDFKGNLAKFGESKRGAKIKRMCEKHANWSED